MAMPVSTEVAINSIDRAAFEGLYAGPAPWVIGKPQPVFAAVAALPAAEASIGHELTADALVMGFAAAVRAYKAVLSGTSGD